jgi:hypothetical protein
LFLFLFRRCIGLGGRERGSIPEMGYIWLQTLKSEVTIVFANAIEEFVYTKC